MRSQLSTVGSQRLPAKAGDVLEGRDAVALLALLAKLAVVIVILGMAGAAGRRGAGRVSEAVSMTVGTCNVLVPADQFEVGLQVVVEGRSRPAVAGVARPAVVTQRVLVDIVVAMTVDAVGRCGFETIITVAGLAGRRGVQACERKR